MRVRWLRNLRHLWLWFLSIFVVPVVVRLCQKSSLRVLAVVSVCLLMVWWTKAGDDLLCDGHDIQQQICSEYANRQIAGNLCYDLCVTKIYRLSGCDRSSKQKGVRIFQVLHKEDFLRATTALVSLSVPDLQPGMLLEDFKDMLSTVLVNHLDRTPELGVLVSQLLDDFDFNRDAKSTGAVPYFNGSCGALSIWHEDHHSKYLYNSHSLRFLSFFYPKVYRITLPTWPRRAKVVLSLLELAEHLMETYGARFHLCNIKGASLYHTKNNEIAITATSQLLSSQQIVRALSNRTCHHDHDCIYSSNCQTKCHMARQTCTGILTRPTVASICDIIQDYLVFDAPKTIRPTLARRVRRCQELWTSPSGDFQVKHSVIVLDIKAMLWRCIQDLKL